MDVRLAMTGFGNVGRSVAQLLADHRDEYEARYGVRLLLTGVADRRGAVASPAGLDEPELLRSKEEQGSVSAATGDRFSEADESFLRRSEADVFIEAASTNFDDAEPGWSILRSALSFDMDLVMASKGALVLYFKELMALAASRGRSVSYSATLGAPLPVLELTNRALLGINILGFEGVLNSIFNLIL
jgi:homoserine dehydrogenase